MASVSFATTILTAISYFLRLESDELRLLDEQQFQSHGKHHHKAKIYDFIVVGAGSAGCIVASRLSKNFNVLLLEAGGDPPSFAEVPAFYEYVTDSPDINYFYTSVPQQSANNRRLMDTMGRMIGGSGSHNALVYNRGHPDQDNAGKSFTGKCWPANVCRQKFAGKMSPTQSFFYRKDYDNWAQITRDPSWSYNSILKYFQIAESYKGIWPRGVQHGTQGQIILETSTRPILPIWEKAAVEMGYTLMDPNGPQREGFTPSDVMRQDGRRVSTYTAYIQPYTDRKTLTILKYAIVQRVLFAGNQATGVEYIRHGVKTKVYATKEVIISAGTYSSPIVLLKSGIGPRDILDEVKIRQRSELPVGRNLQNHAGVALGPFSVTDPSKLSNVNNNLTNEIFDKYLNHERETVLSETGLGPQAFFVSPEAKKRGEFDWPDFQMFHEGTNFGGAGTSAALPPNHFLLAILVGRPEFNEYTLGTVSLNATAYRRGSTDTAELSQIDFKFLRSEQDYKVLRYGIQTALRIFNTRAFRSIGTSYIKDADCEAIHKYNTNDYWDCFIKKIGRTWYHAAGTCRMSYGQEDSNSVVDPKLRVHGFKGLRVVDASIMPRVTNANTNAPVVAIAEKASAEILHEYQH